MTDKPDPAKGEQLIENAARRYEDLIEKLRENAPPPSVLPPTPPPVGARYLFALLRAELKGRDDKIEAERMLSDQLAEAAEAAQRWILRGTMTDGSEEPALRLLHEALKAYREDRR